MAPRARPLIIGYQDWRDLLFLHWRVPAAEVAGLVHPRLSIDEFEGSAWVSMTPFTLRKGRFRGLPPLPDFHELNFRTYVTHPRHGPGIWFFSLDAANPLAVAIARLSVRLPYFPARMKRGEGWYRSERLLRRGRFEVRFSTGAERGRAAPGSLEEFLVERYRLYSRAAGPALWCGVVRHEPWLLFDATVAEVNEDLSTAAGVPALGRPHFAAWSPGVSVAFEHFRPA
ncbi:MAG: DUF2071 domain-containing protein [Deltaproteobacteria bacterium]|nr:MAG: DUF2071 domain-containing protein [Deltaproteobacteria bacterium]